MYIKIFILVFNIFAFKVYFVISGIVLGILSVFIVLYLVPHNMHNAVLFLLYYPCVISVTTHPVRISLGSLSHI